MIACMFNKKWGKYGYKYYYVNCGGKYKGMVRNEIYCYTVFNNMTPAECDECLTKNRTKIEEKMCRENEELFELSTRMNLDEE